MSVVVQPDESKLLSYETVHTYAFVCGPGALPTARVTVTLPMDGNASRSVSRVSAETSYAMTPVVSVP